MQVFSGFEGEYASENAMESSVLRIQGLEIALERAIEDISLLQKNLGFVIELKEQREAELRVRDRREDTLLKEYQRELAKRDAQIDALKAERAELAELLTDTQESLNAREESAAQREEEKRRLERIVEDQRTTLHALEEQLLAAKYSSDLSSQSITFDTLKIQELEQEADRLRFDASKARNALEKEAARARKLEKEVEGFKNWLGGVMGVRKVVEGCEGVLMQEIESRLSAAPRF